MAGNVEEWTSTKWCEDYERKRCTEDRVVRGGSFADHSSRDLRAASRRGVLATYRNGLVGFRCAR